MQNSKNSKMHKTHSSGSRNGSVRLRFDKSVPKSARSESILDLIRRKYEWIKQQSDFPKIGKPESVTLNSDGGWQCKCGSVAVISLRPGAVEATEVHGAVCAKWMELGGPEGNLGYPVSDVEPYTGMGRPTDRISKFERGDITWNSQKDVCYVGIKKSEILPVSGPEEESDSSGSSEKVISFRCPCCGASFSVVCDKGGNRLERDEDDEDDEDDFDDDGSNEQLG